LRRNVVSTSYNVSLGVKFSFLIDPSIVTVNISILGVSHGTLGKPNVHPRALDIPKIVQASKAIAKPARMVLQQDFPVVHVGKTAHLAWHRRIHKEEIMRQEFFPRVPFP
jgi:hypothetical protein